MTWFRFDDWKTALAIEFEKGGTTGVLAGTYDAVVANPPYMGSKYYSPTLKSFVNAEYKEAKADLYACFMQRNVAAASVNGFVGMITIPNWMFLSSFEELRKSLLDKQTIDTFIHNGRGVFGSDFGSCAFAFRDRSLPQYRGTYRRLFDKQGSVASNEELESRFFTSRSFMPHNADFGKIPGSPVAYWASDGARKAFSSGTALSEVAKPRQGLATSDNGRFLRQWQEVSLQNIAFDCSSRDQAAASKRKWFPCQKGGSARRWYGNHLWVVNWQNDGQELLDYARELYGSPTRTIKNIPFYFREGITWGTISISSFSMRYCPPGFISETKGAICFANDPKSCITSSHSQTLS